MERSPEMVRARVWILFQNGLPRKACQRRHLKTFHSKGRETALQDLGKDHWRQRIRNFKFQLVREHVILIKIFLPEKHSASISYTESDCFTESFGDIMSYSGYIFSVMPKKSEGFSCICEEKRRAKCYSWVFSPSNRVNDSII